MLESLPVILIISTILGFLAGIGVGGGSLLMLWLTLVIGFEHSQARFVNLLFFLPSALISCLFRWKQGSLKIRHVLPAIIAGSVSALLCSLLSLRLDTALLKNLFGGLLLFAGAKELSYREKK